MYFEPFKIRSLEFCLSVECCVYHYEIFFFTLINSTLCLEVYFST